MPEGRGVVKCFIDIIFDVPDPVPKTELKERLLTRSPLSQLPAPYGTKKDLQVKCLFDLAIVPQSDANKFYVLKIFNFKEKISTSEAASICYGKPRMVDWTGEVRTTKKVIHYIFDHLGGFQCRQHVLRSREDGQPEKERNQEGDRILFDCIGWNQPWLARERQAQVPLVEEIGHPSHRNVSPIAMWFCIQMVPEHTSSSYLACYTTMSSIRRSEWRWMGSIHGWNHTIRKCANTSYLMGKFWKS